MAGNPNGRLKVAFVSDYLQATKDDKDFLAHPKRRVQYKDRAGCSVVHA
jgi:hypothetical protein